MPDLHEVTPLFAGFTGKFELVKCQFVHNNTTVADYNLSGVKTYNCYLAFALSLTEEGLQFLIGAIEKSLAFL